jgi:hypothetical protein
VDPNDPAASYLCGSSLLSRQDGSDSRSRRDARCACKWGRYRPALAFCVAISGRKDRTQCVHGPGLRGRSRVTAWVTARVTAESKKTACFAVRTRRIVHSDSPSTSAKSRRHDPSTCVSSCRSRANIRAFRPLSFEYVRARFLLAEVWANNGPWVRVATGPVTPPGLMVFPLARLIGEV